MFITNPFITIGYSGPDYFCDRVAETEKLYRELINGNNVILLSHRRTGKSGLIKHCFETKKMSRKYNTFIVDIYSAKNLKEFTLLLANAMVQSLKTFDEKSLDLFLSVVTTLQGIISSTSPFEPSVKVQYAGKPNPEYTLDQIFEYVRKARKPSIIAIDEFQQIANFPEDNVEAILRTYTQQVPDSRFIFAGSERRVMGRMFTTEGRPFYQSATPLTLDCIPLDRYAGFIENHFRMANKSIDKNVIENTYEMFNGVTWYIQKMMNEMFGLTPSGGSCTVTTYDMALDDILLSFDYIYEDNLFKIPDKQRELLIALAIEGKTKEPQSETFCKKYNITASSVQSAKRGLLAKEYITEDLGIVYLYDKFFELWLKRRFRP